MSDDEDSFKAIIIKAVKDALADKTKVIDSYLKRYALSLDDIYDEPEEIRTALYNIFRADAPRIEQEIISNMLIVTNTNNLIHAIKLLNIYRKVSKCNKCHGRCFNDILELLEIEEHKHCKSCDSTIDPSRCRYENALTGLCCKCYYLQKGIVESIINKEL